MQIWLFGTQFILVEEIYILLPRTGCFASDRFAEVNAFVQRPSLQAGYVMHCIRIRSTQGPLGREFLAQGVGVFVVMSGLSFLSAFVYLTPNRQYNGISLPFIMILSPIMACRLTLHLRARVSKTETSELREQSRKLKLNWRANTFA